MEAVLYWSNLNLLVLFSPSRSKAKKRWNKWPVNQGWNFLVTVESPKLHERVKYHRNILRNRSYERTAGVSCSLQSGKINVCCGFIHLRVSAPSSASGSQCLALPLCFGAHTKIQALNPPHPALFLPTPPASFSVSIFLPHPASV